jgi:hypothetical protein
MKPQIELATNTSTPSSGGATREPPEQLVRLPTASDPDFDRLALAEERAIAAAEAAALEKLFPDVLRETTPAALAELHALVDANPPTQSPSLVGPFVEAEGQALDGENTEFVAVLESPRAMRLIRARAAGFANDPSMIQRSIRAYQRSIAALRAQRGLSLPESVALAEALPRRREDLERVRRDRVRHLEAERDREARAAAEAEAARRAAARAALERQWAAARAARSEVEVEKALALRDLLHRQPPAAKFRIGDEELTVSELLRDLSLGRPYQELWSGIHAGGQW